MSIIVKPLNRFRDPNSNEEYPDEFDKADFALKYISFISDLSEKNNDLLWWAGSIGTRNPFISPLYETLIQYLHIVQEIESKKYDGPEVHLLEENPLLIPQLRKYCKENDLRLKITSQNRMRKYKPRYLIYIAVSVLFIWKTIRRKWNIQRQLGKVFHQSVKPNNDYCVTRTVVGDRAFNEKGEFIDTYLGNLSSYLQEYVNVVSLCSGALALEKKLSLMKSNYPSHILIPQEYFLRISDLFRSIIIPITRRRHFSTGITFEGVEVTEIINNCWTNDIVWHEFQRNLCQYYLIKNLSQRINISHFIHTFENQSWEKMSILALREYSPQTKVIGYQHGGMAPMLFNYILSEKESHFVPLPDLVMTVGEYTKRFLIEHGNYPQDIVKDGGALRYEGMRKQPLKIRTNAKVVFIPLPVSRIGCEKLLDFLIRAFSNHQEYTVLLKEHPVTPIMDILTSSEWQLPSNFRISSSLSLMELLIQCDVLLYFQTTTPIEALLIGIPVIYIDIDRLYDADYVLDDISFKWRVKHPMELINTIDEIFNIDDALFTEIQQEGREYADKYFSAVTDQKVKKFLDVNHSN